jgi:hypothetical protein
MIKLAGSTRDALKKKFVPTAKLPHGSVFFALVILSLSSVLAAAQFTPEEISRRPVWENFLNTAKIVKAEDIGEGVTKPKKFLLSKDGLEAAAVWKRPAALGAEFNDRWECEIAAYRLDKLLDLQMVPPTVERRYRLNAGSLQLWADVPLSEKNMSEQKISVPEDRRDHYAKMRALQRAFDSLIANSDRSLENLRYTADWRMILIDHSRAFRDSYPFVDRLIYGKNGLRTAQDFFPLPRQFVERMRAISYDAIRSAVEHYLTSSQIKAILVRRDLLLKEIDELIAEKGEAAVLY